jgi:crossover junction endodeoxyribonuclease RusA
MPVAIPAARNAINGISNRSQCMEANTPERQLALTLPLPPSVNHLYATVNGRRVLSRAGRDFKARVADDVQAWREREQMSNAAMETFGRHYLSLTITFYFATALRRDLDGGLKIAQDALCEAIGVNDNLVTEIHLSKRVDRQHPRMEVLLQTLSDSVLQEGIGQAVIRQPLPVHAKRRRRHRRRQRSLEELAMRHKWE